HHDRLLEGVLGNTKMGRVKSNFDPVFFCTLNLRNYGSAGIDQMEAFVQFGFHASKTQSPVYQIHNS
ncbi:MAG: hypothetical protein IKU18_04885, partial [Bacteroidales bacterium]|nr:hypothetical protein [Bacteroidales bacterium]